MDKSKLSAEAQTLFNLIEFDSDEELVEEIHKHPFGLIVIYFTGILVALAFLVIFIIAPIFIPDGSFIESFDTSAGKAIAAFAGIILLALTIIMTAIGVYIYNHNVILVTSEKLAQVIYTSIFNRKISQLSIGDVQDVTVNQKGIFARFFNFGTIVVETAGEQQNYTFTFVPDPYNAAKAIVGSHEMNLRKYGN